MLIKLFKLLFEHFLGEKIIGLDQIPEDKKEEWAKKVVDYSLDLAGKMAENAARGAAEGVADGVSKNFHKDN